MNIAKLGLVVLLVASPAIARAQQQSSQTSQSSQVTQATQTQSSGQKQADPLVVAARHDRERKKEQPKPAKVWDNENIPSKPDEINVIGDSSSGTGNAEQNGTPAATSAPAAKIAKNSAAQARDKATISAELAEAKENLESLKTDLDILTRKYGLDQQMFYNSPEYSSDTTGAAKLKAEQDDIEAKKQAVANAQKKVDALTAELNEASENDSKPASNPE